MSGLERPTESAGAGGRESALAVDVVLVGAECPDDRALGGSLGAAAGAAALGRALAAGLLDSGHEHCRISTAPPDGDANALHTAVLEAAARPGRLLVVYLAGQLVEDPRRRRPVLAVAGSRREDAGRLGLPVSWVASAMEHGRHPEALLLVDVAVGRTDWPRLGTVPVDLTGDQEPGQGAGLRTGAGAEAGAGAGRAVRPGHAAGRAAEAVSLQVWGRIVRYGGHGGVSRLRRVAGPEGASLHAGGFARDLAVLLNSGLPGGEPVLDPAALDGALGSAGSPSEGVRDLAAPPRSRLLLRNRAALRGRLSLDALPPELRAELTAGQGPVNQLEAPRRPDRRQGRRERS